MLAILEVDNDLEWPRGGATALLAVEALDLAPRGTWLVRI